MSRPNTHFFLSSFPFLKAFITKILMDIIGHKLSRGSPTTKLYKFSTKEYDCYMVRIGKTGSTLKQTMYAKRVWSADGQTRTAIARDVGYSPAVANSPKQKIEDHRGFNNAMSALALESNNLALSAMHEFKARGFEGFSNKDLVGALNAIGNAWAKFNVERTNPDRVNSQKGNRLRTIILQQVENQTIQAPQVEEVPIEAEMAEVLADSEDPLDF